MYFIRTTKTASLATAVQVVRYEDRKKIIVKHMGSARTPEEILSLKEFAHDWIGRKTKQQSLFKTKRETKSSLLPLDKSEYLGVRYTFIYEVLSQLLRKFNFPRLKNQFLLDLVIMRIIQPTSKLESLEYLSDMFGIQYGKSSLYQALFTFPTLKDDIEKRIVAFAKNHFDFDFSFVFYDVTTLYFESFKDDEFKKQGFSKDNKANQPQIVIGLIVTKDGFPVSYEVFAGNTFEGTTFIPTITKFKRKHDVKNLTVVADAAMISLENVENLVLNKLSYIVGARMANLKLKQITKINDKLDSLDGNSMRITTERGLLICDFSLKRYKKDKREMDKQIVKAENLLLNNKDLKRTKFLKNVGKTKQTLNTDLIDKARLLLGIKGYYTNLHDESNKTIIDHYHSLWHVEQVFRIAKSDLATRPIYHYKQQTIEAHILICFMALAVCKYMELKTGMSIKKMVKQLKSITEARIKNKLTDEIIVMRQKLPEEIERLLTTLSLRY